MPFTGTSPASDASAAFYADRVDLIAADAYEAGLGQAAVILAQMAGLIRSLSDSLNLPVPLEVMASDAAAAVIATA